MLIKLVAFEAGYHTRQVSFRIAAVVFAIGGLLMARAGFGGPEILSRSPYSVTLFIGLFSLGTVIATSILAGGAILRDREYKMEDIVFATSLTHAQYVTSRFAGLVFASLLAFSASVLGHLVGSLMPFPGSEAAGPIRVWPYLWGWLVLGIPNILLGSALIFAMAALTKNAMATHICGIFLYILYWTGSVLGNSPLMAGASPLAPEHAELAVLLEPYGMIGFLEQTRYWTVLEKNSRIFALEGALLLNRMLWTGLALGVFALTYRFFGFRELARWKTKPERTRATPKEDRVAYRPVSPAASAWPRVWSALLSQTKLCFRTTIKSYPFYALLLLWAFFIVVDLHGRITRGELNVPHYPLTGLLLPHLAMPMLSLGSLAVIFFAGELVWLERLHGMDSLLDACPCGNGVFWAGKVLALASVIFTLISFSLAVAVAVQTSHGWFAWELDLYASLFWRTGLPLLFVGILAIAILNATPNKYAGLMICAVIVVLFSGVVLPRSPGIEHPMLRFGYTPELVYSPMAATGYHDPATLGFLVFWCGLAGLLGVATLKLWRRGQGFRFQQVGRFGRLTALACTAVFLASGGALFYYTNIAHTYRSAKSRLDWLADYERTYGGEVDEPAPTVADVALTVDLIPERRSMEARGRLTIRNQTNAPLATILVGFAPEIDRHRVHLANATLLETDARHGHYRFALAEPLAVGAESELEFEIAETTSSFESLNPENYITANASYIEIDKLLPFFGYDAGRAIRGKRERLKRGLPEAGPQPALDGLTERKDWVGFDAVVSTSGDQTVVTLGTLERHWREGGRAYFHYRSEREVPYGFGIASAVYRQETMDVDDVAVSLYVHPGHGYNRQSILAAAADSLFHYREHFGEYPDPVLKIAELPGFSDRFGGTSYPNTVFAVENRVFLVHQTPETLDVAYRCMAHEVAHQWWGGLLDPAPVDGARMLTELLAVYSEMIVYERRHPARDTERVLDLTNDLYFYFRGFESEVERPLAGVGRQPYVYYFKGAQVVYALRELLGEEGINRVLREFLQDFAYPRKPRPDALVARLMAIAPPELRPRISELLTRVVTYDLKILSVTAERLDGDLLEIEATVSCQKKTVDQQGAVSVAPVNGWVEIGLWRESEMIALEKVLLESESQTFRIRTVEGVDAVSLDPRRLMLDADRNDNRRIIAAEIAEAKPKPPS